ncbi:hypothetical protein QO010_000822 [Caulobacter ginsengisoli]|uniref:Spermidine synthase n=1 Tax=Caulobacter ginsengisoli TaxID=400775 RepID=A0ABU0IM31_9CAUL|nr:fused MFS/spermidine synthase [Caulobacter ginsengisoli]MDQ0463074.1 hypothetical protein [Caulobacter ginsengisoli]
MTAETAAAPKTAPSAPPFSSGAWLFALAVFSGAALVFLVEPMVAKLVLPLLGGSANVWNTSLAFFQAALLAGYGYAHLLQKLPSVRRQGLVHLAVLVLAALVLTPLKITGLMGEPWAGRPVLWLLTVLTVSIGAPFAALSATAPLVQAWHARVFRHDGAPQPWALYAASNLGSLIALLVYPILVEPSLTLGAQRWGWTVGYGGFVILMAVLVIAIRRRPEPPPLVAPIETGAVSWRQRLLWIALAAAPSSLMLGVTTYITTDIASAPFLWVAPLALYLLTFIIAFQDRPWIPRGIGLILQAAAVVICAALFSITHVLILLPVHLIAFFLTALMCHQALVARRPDPAHLTDFYLCMSLGGVIGGGFNAFLAPVIFSTVLEYPLVLVLACLARPWTRERLTVLQGYVTGVSVVAMAAAAVVLVTMPATVMNERGVQWLAAIAAGAAFFVRSRTRLFTLLVAGLMSISIVAGSQSNPVHAHRSFFGVVHESLWPPQLGFGKMRLLTHGTTLHGAQLLDEADHCRPMVYYSPYTPIGEVFHTMQARGRPMTIGTVGLGTGTVATFVRPGDRLTFFEIDPMIVKLSGDPTTQSFDYTTACAKGPIDYVLGDARLTLQKQPADKYDLLLIDGFSSDAVPVHLLTVEAVKIYLSKIKPDGVIILHLSNRNLELPRPAAAVAQAAGGYALFRRYLFIDRGPCYYPETYYDSEEDALIVARSPEVLEAFKAADRRWVPGDPRGVRPWTDDYTNLFSSLVRRMVERSRDPPPRPVCRG